MTENYRYMYSSISDSTAISADDWVNKVSKFLEALKDGWEIVSSQPTASSVHYILRKSVTPAPEKLHDAFNTAEEGVIRGHEYVGPDTALSSDVSEGGR